MLIIAIPVLSFIIGFYSGVTESFGGWGHGSIKGLFYFGIAIALAAIIILVTGVVAPTHYQTEWKRDLISLRGKQATSGEFFLGSGKVEGIMKYYYFYPTENGYKLGSVRASKSTISYSDSPNIKKKFEYFDSDLIQLIIFPSTWKTRYHIEVPEGSIRQEYVPIS